MSTKRPCGAIALTSSSMLSCRRRIISGDSNRLWTRQVAADEFEVCCIPFFLYDVALGDVVRTAPRDQQRYVVERVVRPSERYVFRVWFGSSFHPREGIAEELNELGALTERSSLNLLSVDADSTERAQAVADYLDAREKLGELTYETGRSA